MKRVFLLLLLSIFMGAAEVNPVHAGFVADKKAQIQQNKLENNYKKQITNLFAKQDEYAKKYDIEAIKSLYSDDFVDNDGYNKDVYFSLVQETWDTYPDITYATQIKNITLNGEYAVVETVETSVATADDLDRALLGELHSKSNCRYHLQRFSNKWEITGEEVLDEFSTLKYGDARYVDMHIESPKVVGAGKQYTSKLKVDLPSDYVLMGSLTQEKIVNPAVKPEEVFKRLSSDQSLARVFVANEDNVNEYTVASVAIASTQAAGKDRVKVYMNGLAFVMSRVNIVPKNNFARVDSKPKTKEPQKGKI